MKYGIAYSPFTETNFKLRTILKFDVKMFKLLRISRIQAAAVFNSDRLMKYTEFYNVISRKGYDSMNIDDEYLLG